MTLAVISACETGQHAHAVAAVVERRLSGHQHEPERLVAPSDLLLTLGHLQHGVERRLGGVQVTGDPHSADDLLEARNVRGELDGALVEERRFRVVVVRMDEPVEVRVGS